MPRFILCLALKSLDIRLSASQCIYKIAACAIVWAGASSASAQGWPTADCQSLLQSGFPKPLWGSSEKLGQDALLMMINYQLAVSLCQQDELLKIQRGQKPVAKLAEPPSAKSSKDPSPPIVPSPASVPSAQPAPPATASPASASVP